MRVNRSSTPAGYLLLEVTLAIAITAMILGTIFKIADWNLNVSNDAMENSNLHMKESAFFSFLDRAFLELNGDAIVQLTTTESPTQHLSELIIQNPGEVFSWAGQPFVAKAVKISTKPNANKTIDIILEYFADPLLSDGENTSGELIDPNQEPLQTLVLLDEIWQFEWLVWNGRDQDRDYNPSWATTWDPNTPPLFFELKMTIDLEARHTIHRFWCPSKVNPAQHHQSTWNTSTGNARQPDGTASPE